MPGAAKASRRPTRWSAQWWSAPDGVVVGQGRHPRAGEAHAEVFALDDAGGARAARTLYVTLEPCCHVGPHRSVHPAHHCRRHPPRRCGDARPESARQRQGFDELRAHGIRSRSACWATMRRASTARSRSSRPRAADGDRQGGDQPGRQDRRRAGRAHRSSPRPKRIAGRSGCERRWTRSASDRARCWPTIRC